MGSVCPQRRVFAPAVLASASPVAGLVSGPAERLRKQVPRHSPPRDVHLFARQKRHPFPSANAARKAVVDPLATAPPRGHELSGSGVERALQLLLLLKSGRCQLKVGRVPILFGTRPAFSRQASSTVAQRRGRASMGQAS